MIGDLHPSSTHPPLPPTTEDIRFHHLRLLRSHRVGASTYHRLIAEHGSARAALDALPEVAATSGVTDYEICPEGVIAAELKAARRAGARLLLHGYEGYPAALMEIDDAPPALWALGDLALLNKDIIAFSGARNASALGCRTAKSIARDLAKAGYVVASSLARGIDAAAQEAAAEHGSIAVHASGVDVIYPSESKDLAAQVARCGLRISDQPLGARPVSRHFPTQARIIAGLSRACVVIETGLKSGSLNTARDASDMGREVLAVPGHPFDARSAGCNVLIRDGATLIRGAEDVVEAIGPIARPVLHKLTQGTPVIDRLSNMARSTRKLSGTQTATQTDTQALHSQILQQLGPDPVAIDQLIRSLQARPDELAPVLTELELNGDIQRHAGGLLSRCA